jgi:hypothetical protein
LFACLSPNRAKPGSASSALCPLRCRASTPPPRCRVHEREVSFPLHLVVDPAFEPRLDRAMRARCLYVARCPAPRRRADPPSLESRPSSRAGHLQMPLPTATRALLALHRVDLVPTSARRVPARCRHPHVCTAVVRHALARTPEGLNPSVLSCSPEVQSSTFSG